MRPYNCFDGPKRPGGRFTQTVKILLQRVGWAEVAVAGRLIARIGRGLLLLVGVADGDQAEDAARLAGKISELRIFEDPPGKMNHSVRDVRGEVLAVPQFTLLADTRRGRRPDFSAAADPAAALGLFEDFCRALAGLGVPVQQGCFREHMQIQLQNDGPVTIMLDSRA